MNLDKYTIDMATHHIKCRHAIGTHGYDYFMPCIVVSVTKSAKVKVVVFGDRYWNGRDNVKRIRYVSPSKLRNGRTVAQQAHKQNG